MHSVHGLLWRPSSVVDDLFSRHLDNDDDESAPFPIGAGDFSVDLDRPLRRHNDKTGSYIYCDIPDHSGSPKRHWVFVRKCQEFSRLRLLNTAATGAAGTKQCCWGKWTSLGGTVDSNKDRTLYDAAINEINHEAQLPLTNLLTKDQVSVQIPGKIQDVANPRAELIYAEGLNRTSPTCSLGVFVFRWADPAEFVQLFPQWPNHRRNTVIVQASVGEIDAVCSMTQPVMEHLQAQEYHRAGQNNNFFTDYSLQTLYERVLPDLAPILGSGGAKPEWYEDQAKGKRTPWEFPGVRGNPEHPAEYKEGPNRDEYGWA
tara:strand:- start:3963 stop:4907 length:945 start_codon:yes stop_codon:yes gene_type:complete